MRGNWYSAFCIAVGATGAVLVALHGWWLVETYWRCRALWSTLWRRWRKAWHRWRRHVPADHHRPGRAL